MSDTQCKHERVERWRAGKYELDGNHGPEMTRTKAQENLRRSWTICPDCGMRLERAVLA